MTQDQKVSKYLKENVHITQLVAWSEFGVWRLASRISTLRTQGMNIKTTMKKAANGSRYALYELQN